MHKCVIYNCLTTLKNLKNPYSFPLSFKVNILTLALFFVLISFTYADAYIDPNTGGFFFQTVAPFIYGILAVIVVFWKRITGLVKGIFSRKKNQPNSLRDE